MGRCSRVTIHRGLDGMVELEAFEVQGWVGGDNGRCCARVGTVAALRNRQSEDPMARRCDSPAGRFVWGF
jgi:hypothetical protein